MTSVESVASRVCQSREYGEHCTKGNRHVSALRFAFREHFSTVALATRWRRNNSRFAYELGRLKKSTYMHAYGRPSAQPLEEVSPSACKPRTYLAVSPTAPDVVFCIRRHMQLLRKLQLHQRHSQHRSSGRRVAIESIRRFHSERHKPVHGVHRQRSPGI